jgi:hypothetical protein
VPSSSSLGVAVSKKGEGGERRRRREERERRSGWRWAEHHDEEDVLQHDLWSGIFGIFMRELHQTKGEPGQGWFTGAIKNQLYALQSQHLIRARALVRHDDQFAPWD